MDHIQRTIHFNPQIESYEGFFDYEWQKQLLEVVRHSVLRQPGYDLTRCWEAVSNARQMPWLMVKCLDARMYDTLAKLVPWDNRKISIMRDRLVKKIETRGGKLSHSMRKRIQEAITEIDKEALDLREEVRDEVFDRRGDLWDALIKHDTFNTSLWSSERMSYASIYYGYEWFLTKCVSIRRREPDYRCLRWKTFVTEFEAAFGEPLASNCLRDPQINLARLTRNTLAHNGGRMTDELRNENHTFVIEGDEIQINSEHTTHLYRHLASKVLQMAELAVTLPEFAQ